jgi:hypothetical protein
MLQTEVAEKIKTHVLCSVNLVPKIMPFMRYVEKYGTAGQATDDNTIRRTRFPCWINQGYRHTLRIRNTVAFQRQQLLRERAAMLRHTYEHNFCLVSHFQVYQSSTVRLFHARQ